MKMKSHILWMVGAFIVVVLAAKFIGASAYLLLFLMCFVMMVAMMVGMNHNTDAEPENNGNDHKPTK